MTIDKNLFVTYKNAFLRCYPQKKVEVAPAGQGKYHVLIDGIPGEPLTKIQLAEAIRSFNNGYLARY